MTNMQNETVQEFWRVFKASSSELATTLSADTDVYDRILRALQQVHPDLFFEFSTSASPCEFIVTAEGNRSLFDLVRTVVSLAPPDTGWTLIALKPQIGFPVTASWEDFTIELERVVFAPLESRTGECGIRLLVPAIPHEQVENAHNALLRAIDHGLGEERFAEEIAHTELRCLPADADATEFIPLAELERYLDWRRNRR